MIAWAAALEAASRARVTLVLGPSDTGKTSLTTLLAAALAEQGPTAVVDADLGQSEIGPPTTIGLGRARPRLARLADAEVLALEFVGTTTPVRNMKGTTRATKALVDRALAAGFEHVVVDTCGLVAGGLAQAFRRAQIDLVSPDLLVALQRAGEVEHILAVYAAAGRPPLVRLGPLPGVVKRSQAERRRRRESALAAYFAPARSVEVGIERIAPERVRPEDTLDDALVGLRDAKGETLGIGRISAVDVAGGRLTIVTPVDGTRIDAVTPGSEKYRG